MSELTENITLFILDSNESPALFITHYTKWVVDSPSSPSFEWDFYIIDSPNGQDLILGYNFLYDYNPIIDWKNGLITYDSSHKDCSGIKNSASNALATAVNHVALSEALWAYISENVEKGFISTSSSLTGKPVHFVKKKDGGLRLSVDYCKFNAFTRKNRYPFPPMNQLLTISNGFTIFSKVDLCGAYNLLRIKEADEHLAAIRTKYSSYEYLVMPFGLTNAPASFQNLMNDIFSAFMDIFVVVYLDDIMVSSSSEEEHINDVALSSKD
ncbi:hypothetical protein O181_042441 [Austropuccinia psidii MF-1]|uniref:Reverse transcriptase domain-containing protein n=1 Tax=Austropuccinia psidii MF-1 TaxID=1389203 RepID=A0A9Q3DEV6_9BASI|nr:hypothetical protein [Austropuccinia psidii MF-1]